MLAARVTWDITYPSHQVFFALQDDDFEDLDDAPFLDAVVKVWLLNHQ